MLLAIVYVSAGAHAQTGTNLLANPSFENNPPTTLGNNIGYSVAPWIIGGTGYQANVVVVDGPGGYNYGQGGPESDANPATGAGVLQRYLDVNGGQNSFHQSFVVPTCGSAPGQTRTIRYSGWFSTRENRGIGTASISIRSGNGTSGAILSQQLVTLPNPPLGSQFQPWVQVSGTVNVAAGSTVSYVVDLPDYYNFDEAFMAFDNFSCPSAQLTIAKTWSNAIVGNRVAVNATRNGTLIDSHTSTATTANSTSTDASPVTVFQGEQITLTEAFSIGSPANYTSVLTCIGGGSLVGNILTVNSTGTAINCTFTNTRPAADLQVTKTNGVSDVTAGSTTIYTVTVTNNGPSDVSGAMLSDPIAGGLTKVSIACSPTPGACVDPPTISQLQSGSFVLPTLSNGQTYQLLVTASVTGSGSVTNTATVTPPTNRYDPQSGNNSASDTDTVSAPIPLVLSKTSAVHSDPINGTANALAIPNALVDYTITLTNPNAQSVAANTIMITDPIPAAVALFTGNLGVSGPINFDGNGSGLMFTFGGLASTTDDIDFSTDGVNWGHIPQTPYDPAVTHIRVRPQGSMAPGTSTSFTFRVLVL